MNGTEEGPTIDEIRACEETVAVNRKALERLVKIANNVFPQNAYDRSAIYTARDALADE